MRNTIQIRNCTIGENEPIFIIAEVGVTCNYDMKISKELIDVVAEAGAQAIKFIFWFPEEIMSDKTISYTYQTLNGEKSENMFEMLEGLRFTLDEWHELKKYADEKNVILLATVNSPSGIEYAEAIGLEAYKLSSWDYNHHPLWRSIAQLGKPMIIDTGPVTSLDVAKVFELMKAEGNDQSLLVHCYHTNNFEEINMRAIPYMRRAFNTLVGFSAKDLNPEMDISAIALGICYLEKRLTMDRSLPGHHHNISLEPKEFIEYVKMVRNVKDALGVEDLKPSQADLEERKKWFRHLVVNQDVSKGTRLTVDMLEGKRPEQGISPEFINFFIDKEVKRDIKYNESLAWEDV